MAFERNKPATNPNRRPMSVADMRPTISKENKKALALLDELDRKEGIKGICNKKRKG